MADFKTHITVSTGLGIAYGCWGHFTAGLSIDHCLIAGGLCSVSGMLPDLDSDSSVPQREMLSLLSVITPVLMISRFIALGMSTEQIVFATVFVYLFVRLVIGGIFQKFTSHRGMWHSIPAAVVAGLATFLLCHSFQVEVRIFKAWAVVLGFISHLVLDEIFAVNWAGRRLKSSFGTALKLFSPLPMPNLVTYGSLSLLVMLIVGDEYAMDQIKDQDMIQTATDLLQDILKPNESPPTSLTR